MLEYPLQIFITGVKLADKPKYNDTHKHLTNSGTSTSKAKPWWLRIASWCAFNANIFRCQFFYYVFSNKLRLRCFCVIIKRKALISCQ